MLDDVDVSNMSPLPPYLSAHQFDHVLGNLKPPDALAGW